MAASNSGNLGLNVILPFLGDIYRTIHAARFYQISDLPLNSLLCSPLTYIPVTNLGFGND